MKLFKFLSGLLASAYGALDTDTLMALILTQPNMYRGDGNQMGQMNSLLPVLLLNKEGTDCKRDNTDILLLSLMQNPSVGQYGADALLPYLLLSRDSSGCTTDSGSTVATDKKALLLTMAMLNRDQSCTGVDNHELGEHIMTNMLMKNTAGEDDIIMTMLLMQAMSAGNGHQMFNEHSLLPHLVVDKVKH